MSDYILINGELYHHGVKGMKWGKRKARNSNYTPSKFKQKRISKQYSKFSTRAMDTLRKQENSMTVKAHNEAADVLNRTNDMSKKSYERLFTKNMNKQLNEFYSTDKNIKKAEKLVDKYNMTKWNEFARHNRAVIEEGRRYVEKGI